MENTSIAGGWGGGGVLTFPLTGEGVQIHVPSGLCRQGFRLKMLENALFGA